MVLYRLGIVIVLTAAVVACGRAAAPDQGKAAGRENAAGLASEPLLISPEDILVVDASDRARGPLITGSIQLVRLDQGRSLGRSDVLAQHHLLLFFFTSK